MFKKIWRAFLAAVASPEAVKQERSLAAFVLFRVLLAAGASAGLADIVSRLVHG